jgi:hypothetical protein
MMEGDLIVHKRRVCLLHRISISGESAAAYRSPHDDDDDDDDDVLLLVASATSLLMERGSVGRWRR